MLNMSVIEFLELVKLFTFIKKEKFLTLLFFVYDKSKYVNYIFNFFGL